MLNLQHVRMHHHIQACPSYKNPLRDDATVTSVTKAKMHASHACRMPLKRPPAPLKSEPPAAPRNHHHSQHASRQPCPSASSRTLLYDDARSARDRYIRYESHSSRRPHVEEWNRDGPPWNFGGRAWRNFFTKGGKGVDLLHSISVQYFPVSYWY